MVRRRTKTIVATLAIIMLVLPGIFSGVALAESTGEESGDNSRALQQVEYNADFLCLNNWTRQFRVAFSPSCGPNETLIQVSASLPFDYCYSRSTRILSDDLPGDKCQTGSQYVVVDGTSSFFVCYNFYTRQLLHVNSTAECNTGAILFFIDLRGDLTKYACVEENLNPDQCDYFPAGPHNEIREIGPIPNTSGGFIDCTWQWVFNGNNSPTQSCNNDSSNADIEAALEALPGINDVTVTGGPIAGTIDEPIRIEFVGVDAQTDIVPQIMIQNVGSTIDQSDTTIVDGAVNGPEVSYVIPNGMVSLFQAGGATDPNNPATYGPEVAGSPMAVDPTTGAATFTDLFEGNYVVCADGTDAVTPSCEIITINSNVLSIVNNINMFGTITAEITNTADVNEVQFIRQCSFSCRVDGGTFTITFDGQTTGNLDADATKAEVETALEALSNIDAVAVTGDDFALGFNPGNEMQIEFQGSLAGQGVPELTLNTSLVGAGFGLFYEKGTVTQGAEAVHTLTLDDRVNAGTFTLTYDNGTTSSTTGPIAWDATVGEVQTALNALASINGGGGNVTVSTTSTDPAFPPQNTKITAAPFEVNFTGVANANTNVLIVDNTNLE